MPHLSGVPPGGLGGVDIADESGQGSADDAMLTSLLGVEEGRDTVGEHGRRQDLATWPIHADREERPTHLIRGGFGHIGVRRRECLVRQVGGGDFERFGERDDQRAAVESPVSALDLAEVAFADARESGDDSEGLAASVSQFAEATAEVGHLATPTACRAGRGAR
ncbi:hypothetical protein UO65_2229 [Actinokineospora spheciospongiae]|uniref:Uncharacterized protein n=1 Tax=Actinokineospora spheciospongiae TaxID=909613 RepID=W7J0E8_9PSEU|nr:hypothetical protein UO65_2229 [Actinokineospora spheciospongiae]